MLQAARPLHDARVTPPVLRGGICSYSRFDGNRWERQNERCPLHFWHVEPLKQSI